MAFDTKYLWRVDTYESNSPDPDIVHTGPVWSFTTVPENPIIDVQPQSVLIDAGQEAVYMTAATLYLVGMFRAVKKALETKDIAALCGYK